MRHKNSSIEKVVQLPGNLIEKWRPINVRLSNAGQLGNKRRDDLIRIDQRRVRIGDLAPLHLQRCHLQNTTRHSTTARGLDINEDKRARRIKCWMRGSHFCSISQRLDLKKLNIFCNTAVRLIAN